MEILGIGGFEIALVIIIALIVAGPGRMAVWARTFGQWVAKMRQLWSVTAAQLQRELDDAGVDFKVPKDIPSRQSLVKELSRSAAVRDLVKPVEEIQSALKESQTAAKDGIAEIRSAGDAIKNATRIAPVKPPQYKPNPAPAAPPEGDGFGTWGGKPKETPAAQPADLGTWGGASADKEQS